MRFAGAAESKFVVQSALPTDDMNGGMLETWPCSLGGSWRCHCLVLPQLASELGVLVLRATVVHFTWPALPLDLGDLGDMGKSSKKAGKAGHKKKSGSKSKRKQRSSSSESSSGDALNANLLAAAASFGLQLGS